MSIRSRLLPTLTLLVFALAATSLVAAPTKQWKQGDPTADEQYALEVINRVRIDPAAAVDFYIEQMSTIPALAAILAYSNPSWSTAKDSQAAAIAWYKQTYNRPEIFPPRPAYALYPLFSEQAAAQGTALLAGTMDPLLGMATFAAQRDAYYAKTLTPSDSRPAVPALTMVRAQLAFSPEAPALSGSNATGGTATIKAGGDVTNDHHPWARDQLLFAVNFSDPTLSLREAFIENAGEQKWMPALFDDSWTYEDNVTNRGHTRMIGLATSGVRSSDPGAGGRSLFAFGTDLEAFGVSDLPYGANTVFITGVVYKDLNKDGDYSPGEGIAGVTVMPNVGNYYAVTSGSGGYAIPIQANRGTVALTITRSGTDFSKAVVVVDLRALTAGGPTTSVQVGSNNVKLDFVLPPDKAPQVNVAASDPGAPSIVNLSSRGVAEPGEHSFIGGFTLSGPSNAKKTLLIRAVGYSLGKHGVHAYLPKPMLQLYAGGTLLATVVTSDLFTSNPAFNPAFDEGQTFNCPVIIRPELDSAMKSVYAFGLSIPTDPGSIHTTVTSGIKKYGDDVLMTELPAGGYTVVVSPDPATPADVISFADAAQTQGTAYSGVVLLELYDMSRTDGLSLINLSSRGYVSNTLPTGYPPDQSLVAERQMIMGFVLDGGASSAQRRLIARGVSPSLVDHGVTDVLSDPTLTTYNADGSTFEVVDDWGSDSHADQLAALGDTVGAFPLSATSKDAATIFRFSAGLHTVRVTSNQGKSSGVVLAEIYQAD